MSSEGILPRFVFDFDSVGGAIKLLISTGFNGAEVFTTEGLASTIDSKSSFFYSVKDVHNNKKIISVRKNKKSKKN